MLNNSYIKLNKHKLSFRDYVGKYTVYYIGEYDEMWMLRNKFQ